MILDRKNFFLPDKDDWNEPVWALGDLLTVPVFRRPRIYRDDPATDCPYNILACSWNHLLETPLTKAMFAEHLRGALKDFAKYLNTKPVFNAYPITHTPPQVEGYAYFDWTGAAYPFDLRAVIMFEPSIPSDDLNDVGEPLCYGPGLKFHLTTLEAKR